MAVAYNTATNKSIVLYSFDYSNVNRITFMKVLTKSDTQDGYLCPSKVNGNNAGYLAVTSLCFADIFSDVRIVVFNFPGPRSLLEVPLPTNGTLGSPIACYIGGRLLIGGSNTLTKSYNLYMTDGLIEDPSEEYFGLEEYGLGDVVQLNCAEEHDMFSIVGRNQNGTKNIGVFYGYSKGQADKRSHSLLKNQNILRSYGFATNHGMAHVLYDNDGFPFFAVSYIFGPIIFTDISTTKPKQSTELATLKEMLKADQIKNLSVAFIATNPNGKTINISQPFVLRSPDQTIRITTNQKTALAAGSNDIEQYVNISGPVFDAKLINNNHSSDVVLRQRIYSMDIYHRPRGPVYDIIRITANNTYAVAVDKDISIVDYFRNGVFQKSLGGLGLGEFEAFTAVRVIEDQEADILFWVISDNGVSKLYA